MPARALCQLSCSPLGTVLLLGLNRNLPFAKQASIAKLKAGDVAMRVTDDAIQILGGHGYMRDFPAGKWHRDAKIYQIWEGTAEIHRLVIARELTDRAL